jgi:hypothetical protein
MVDLQYALQAGRQCRKGRPPVRVMLPAVQHHHVPDHHYYCPADPYLDTLYTDKKENQIFLIHKEIQSGTVAKSYMRKGFLIYEEMRKYFPIYEEAVSHI